MRIRCGLVLALLCLSGPAAAGRCDGAALLRIVNLNPFHRAYTPPGSYGACVLPAGASEAIASLDAASHLTGARSGREAIAIDGETWRPALALRRGLGDGWEHFVELSAVSHNSGAFDGFIEGWHEVFRLPQGGRDRAPRGRLSIRYARDGAGRVDIDDGTFSLGDIALGLGRAMGPGVLSNDGVALRGAVRLPAGGADGLAGVSGAVWAETSGTLSGASRTWLYGAALGALAADPPDALAAVGGGPVVFGRLGLTWRPLRGLALKLQVDASSPPHGGSSLAPLSDPVVMIGMGGTVALGGGATLELAVAEDDGAHRAVPDVGVHLAIRWRP